jgi:hypothetical protein
LHGDFDFGSRKSTSTKIRPSSKNRAEHIPVVTFNASPRQAPVSEEKLRRAFQKALAVEEKDHEKAVA